MHRVPPTNRRRIIDALSDATAALSLITGATKTRTASARRPPDRFEYVTGLTIDDHCLPVTIEIPVVIAVLLDHDSLVALAVPTLTDDFTIAVTITIAMAGPDGHPDRANTNSDFLRASRHRGKNSSRSDGYHCKTLDHCMLLNL